MAFMIDQFLLAASAVFAAKGLWILFDPSSFFGLFLNTVTVTTLSKAPFVFSYLTPMLSSALLIVASICFYATTFPSLHSKVKVARSIVTGHLIIGYLIVTDLLHHNKLVFYSFTNFHLYFSLPVALLTAWAAANCIGGEEEHQKGVKKAK